jgi:O-antigen ligase
MNLEFGWGLSQLVGPIIFYTFVPAFLLTLFYRVEIGIFFLVPFLPLQNVLNYANDFPLGKDINDLMMLAMIIRWIYDKRKNGEKIFTPAAVNWPIVFIILWTFVALWRGAQYLGFPAPAEASDPRVMAWKNLLMLPVLYFIIVNNIKNRRQVEILLVLMCLSMIVLFRNFYAASSSRDLSEYTSWRFIGGGQALGGNSFGVFLGQFTIIPLALMLFSSKSWHKAFFGFTAGLNIYCLMYSFSRSGYLAGAATLVFLGLAKDRRVLAALVILMLFWQALLPHSVVHRIEMTSVDDPSDATAQERFGMWEMAKNIIAEHPIAGIGFCTTPFLQVKSTGFTNTWASFHSSYFEQTVETGFIGLALYVAFFLMGIGYGWKLYKVTDDKLLQGLGLGFMGCVFGVLAGNIFGSYWNYLNVMAFYWVFLGLVIASAKFSESASISEHKDGDMDSSRGNGKADSPNFWETREPVSEFSF